MEAARSLKGARPAARASRRSRSTSWSGLRRQHTCPVLRLRLLSAWEKNDYGNLTTKAYWDSLYCTPKSVSFALKD
jgi:hypothetical protein